MKMRFLILLGYWKVSQRAPPNPTSQLKL